MRRRIGIVGRIDPEATLLDGQTIKTRTLYRHLAAHYGADRIVGVDTRDYRRRAPQVTRELLRCLRTCDDIVVLLSAGGRRALFPILSAAARMGHKRIYHNLIGGHLADNIEQDRSGKLVRQLNSFAINWVESRALERRLGELGVANAAYLPNFKDLPTQAAASPVPAERPFRLCTFSRVTPHKGITNAIQTVAAINAEAGREIATLDIYGPLDPAYAAEFHRLVAAHPGVHYAGVAPAERGVDIMRDYYALLFPTRWPGEGVPGTIIDAMGAGLPVVASRWPYYDEMLEDGVTGLSYDYDHPEQLHDTLRRFLELPEAEVAAMRRAIFTRAADYSAEAVIGEIVSALDAGGAVPARPPRVLIVIHGLNTGGAETMVLGLARELAAAAVPVRVVSLHGANTDVGARMRQAGIDVVALNKAKGPDPRAIGKLRRQIRDFAPTVVHTHLPVLEYVVPAVRLSGTDARIIHTVHNVAHKETQRPALRTLNRRAFTHGVVPVALTEQVRDSICREYGLESSAVPVVGNGVDVERFRCQGDRKVHDGGPRLLCVARMVPAKNHGLLLHTVAALGQTGMNASLTLVGDGPLRGQLEAQARTLGIADRVHFAGLQRDPRPFYQDADLFMLLSDYEGQPMSLIEAMASGLPAVATPVGGVPDVVVGDVNGALVEPDADRAAAAVQAIWNDPDRYARLSAGAVRTAEAHSARTMTEKYLELYR
ncbi:glycosyltransferase [Actinomyces sp. MRS3W]|uniref:glycosyltransferase family 4 protein n=1 Tax=Actinomyces sp. MRS3W TaxID=2800796 RepID=UPI0028FD8846|nr:glycosyltransferase [Actinomyces sp. MRS3W]MDU0349607.1 glycosyltransferase [Actinomyces sp. MRS3W]